MGTCTPTIHGLMGSSLSLALLCTDPDKPQHVFHYLKQQPVDLASSSIGNAFPCSKLIIPPVGIAENLTWVLWVGAERTRTAHSTVESQDMYSLEQLISSDTAINPVRYVLSYLTRCTTLMRAAVRARLSPCTTAPSGGGVSGSPQSISIIVVSMSRDRTTNG